MDGGKYFFKHVFVFLTAFLSLTLLTDELNSQSSSGQPYFDHVCSQNPRVRLDERVLPAISSQMYEIDVKNLHFSDSERKSVVVRRQTTGRDDRAKLQSLLLQASDADGNVVGSWASVDETGAGLDGGTGRNVQNVRCGQSSPYTRDEQKKTESGPGVAIAKNLNADTASVLWKLPRSTPSSVVSLKGIAVDESGQAHEIPKVKLTKRSSPISDLSLDGCGINKGCYLVPHNCNLPNCIYAMTWMTDDDDIHFELFGNVDGWVGVGFTDDRYTGRDQYVVCSRPFESSDDILVQNMYVDETVPVLIDPDNPAFGLNPAYHSAYSSHQISCSFSRPKIPPLSLAGGNRIKDLHDPHYVVATFGNQPEMINGVPNLIHGRYNPIVSRARVNFNRQAHPANQTLVGSWLAKVHMCLMLIAWVLLASIAILTSRYYRPIWNFESSHHSKYSWLTVHQPLVLAVAVLTVVALLFILFEVNWTWSLIPMYLWHSVLGIFVVVLAVINGILVFCVPKSSGRGYCIWFWVHWFVSSLAHCLAIPLIFLGMDMPRLDLWDWCSWLLLAWCIFHIITDFLLEIHYCMTYRRSYERFQEMDGKSRLMDADRDRHVYPPGYRWKPFCLGLYIIVTLAVVLTLIIAVIVFDW